MKTYNKLVRDKIPEIVRGKGVKVTSHIAKEDEFEIKLHEKLLEEIREFLEEENAEELADIFEVLDAIMGFHGIEADEVERIKIEKREERGGFNDRIILDSTD